MTDALRGVALVANTGPWAVGGLAAYARNLTSHLPADVAVTYSARFVAPGPGGAALDYAAREPCLTREFHGAPVSTIAPRSAALPALALSRRAVHHRALHRCAAAAAVAAWRPALQKTIGDPSLIHVIGCGRDLLGFAALAEARRRKIPLTVLPAVHIGSWGDSELDLYRQADAVLAATPVERDHLQDLGVPGARLAVCGLAADTPTGGDGRRFRQAHGLGDRPLVLFLGRKSRGKGYHQLREVLPEVAQRAPGALLVAIGVDAEPPYPDLDGTLLLDLGAADDDVKADALAACDVMCLPSDGEAFGIAYVEAWSYAKPVIGLDTPVSRALIDDGDTGLLAGDRGEGLVAALTRLLSDPAEACAMGRNGQAVYTARYTWDACIATHMDVFSTVLAAR
jgi:glycosyltransferase involved in cell wall biosynthesis